MNARDVCPVCSAGSPSVFLSRLGVPVHQNLLLPSQEAAMNVTRGDLVLTVCEACGFVFNKAFDLGKMSYDERYDNTQTCSPTFEDYVQGLADYLVDERGVTDCRIVEVGCGQGGFLEKLVEKNAGNVGFGFDPACRRAVCEMDGRLAFSKSYYGPEHSDTAADVVICRHTIEHVPQPMELLRSIRQALSGSSSARVFFETPCIEWILTQGVVWDVFYEHCSYFTAESLSAALRAAGFEVESVLHVFGGQYLWVEAHVADVDSAQCSDGSRIKDLAFKFADTEAQRREAWRKMVIEMRERGNVALWGAAAKGVTFANVVDQDRSLVACAVDLNPHKQGCYLPGTGHPIIGHQSIPEHDVRAVLVTNPNYCDEIRTLLTDDGMDVDVVDLMEWNKIEADNRH